MHLCYNCNMECLICLVGNVREIGLRNACRFASMDGAKNKKNPYLNWSKSSVSRRRTSVDIKRRGEKIVTEIRSKRRHSKQLHGRINFHKQRGVYYFSLHLAPPFFTPSSFPDARCNVERLKKSILWPFYQQFLHSVTQV